MYSQEEIKKELMAYKLPWISIFFKKYEVVFMRYSIVPVFVLMIFFAVIYMNTPYGRNDWMWDFDKITVLFYIFCFGGLSLISHFSELIKTNRLRKKLGLSQQEFKILIEKYQITGY